MVVSTTQIHGGDAYNVIPQEVELKGTVRSFIPAVQDMAEANIRRIAASVASAHGAEAEVHYERRYPPTVNEADATLQAEKIEGRVREDAKRAMIQQKTEETVADIVGTYDVRVVYERGSIPETESAENR